MASRISEFLTSPVPRLRSAAQRQASRQNGSRSRGPTTAGGRERSRGNALTHGLFAKAIAPPGDYRGRDVLFGEICRQLVLEFAPTSFSEQATVDSLAGDYLRLTLAKQIAEASLPVCALPQRDAEGWKALAAAEERLGLVTQTLQRCRGEGRVALPAAKAQPLADRLAKLLAGVEKDLAELDDPQFDPLTPEDIALRVPQTKLVKALGAARRRVSSPASLLALLNGKHELTPRSRKLLLAILEYAKTMGERFVQQDDLRNAVARSRQDCITLAGRQLESLALFERYQADVERAIERKLRRLQNRRGNVLGSFL